MGEPYNYLGLMGGPDAFRIAPAVQDAIFGSQQVQQNQNTLAGQEMQLAAQRRAEAARVAQAQLATMPQVDDETFNRLLAPIAEHDPGAAQQMRHGRQMSADLNLVMQNPNPRSIGVFQMRYPEFGKQIQAGFETMSNGERESAFRTASDVYGYLQAEDADGAEKVLQAHIDADKAAGLDTSTYEPLVKLLREDPNRAMFVAGTMMAAHVGPEKFGDTFEKVGTERRKDQLQPFEVSLKKTEADYAPMKAQSDLATEDAQRQRWTAQTENEIDANKLGWAKLDLDADALETNTRLKLQELQQQGAKLPDTAMAEVNKAITSAQTGLALADRTKDLSAQLAQSGARGGFGSNWGEWIKGATGNQDSVTQLRTQYQQIVNSSALKMLPPGPASDKDVAFVKEGFPAPTAPTAYVTKWLDAFSRVQRAVAEGDERRGNWIAANGGSLAPARADISVGGVMVPAGTTFNEFNTNAVKVGKAGQPPAGISALIQRYGTR